MFDRRKFAQILKQIKDTYNSQEEFSEKSKIGRTYLSQYMNMKLDKPPKPEILEKLANASNGVTVYEELMIICGYSEKSLESIVYNIYTQLKKLSQQIYKKDNKDLYEVESAIENFQDYSSNLIESIEKKELSSIYLTDYYRKDLFLEDYNFVCTFLFLYDSFLKCLENEQYITLVNYKYIDWFNMNEVYKNINSLEKLELLSYNSKNIKINIELTEDLLDYIKNFSTAINVAYLSDFDSNALIDLFQKKASNKENKSKNNSTLNKNIKKNNNDYEYYMCPVYGQISAGQPNWAEQNIEGRLPIDTDLMDIINPEEYFFLRVNGESMNNIIRNGAFALIHKQDMVKDGEIAVVLVNGYDATLKRFTKKGDVVVLEPDSSDPSFKTQIYDKTTSIKILGKYVGKMEINK